MSNAIIRREIRRIRTSGGEVYHRRSPLGIAATWNVGTLKRWKVGRLKILTCQRYNVSTCHLLTLIPDHSIT